MTQHLQKLKKREFLASSNNSAVWHNNAFAMVEFTLGMNNNIILTSGNSSLE